MQEGTDTVCHSRYGTCHILNPRLDTGHNVADHVRAPRECLSGQTLDKGNCTVKAVRDGGLDTGDRRGNPGFHGVKSCGRRTFDAVTEGRYCGFHGIPARRNHRFDAIYYTGDLAADGIPDGRNRGLDRRKDSRDDHFDRIPCRTHPGLDASQQRRQERHNGVPHRRHCSLDRSQHRGDSCLNC